VRAIQSVASSFGVEIRSAGLSEPGEIERAIVAEHEANGGVIVTVSPLSTVNRDRIIALAARHKVPAVYPLRYFAASGGLISYGPDRLEPYRRAAVYVDRILKGEKPAELPVQQPTPSAFPVFRLTARSNFVGNSTGKSAGFVPCRILCT
jgi:ABC-type uncharacterized transport system substrate-binding protein